jgi:hypothetical protein
MKMIYYIDFILSLDNNCTICVNDIDGTYIQGVVSIESPYIYRWFNEGSLPDCIDTSPDDPMYPSIHRRLTITGVDDV